MTDPYYQDDFVTLWHGDCLDVLPTLPDASVDSVVTDPPYELGFMGKGWDATGIAYNVTVWRECLRVLKPGGHLLAFGGTRTWHRLAVAIEDAGFELRDSIAWLYGSGFPKSLNVATAIDRHREGGPTIVRCPEDFSRELLPDEARFCAWMRDESGLTEIDARRLLGSARFITGEVQVVNTATKDAPRWGRRAMVPTAAAWEKLRPTLATEPPEWVEALVKRPPEPEGDVPGDVWTPGKGQGSAGCNEWAGWGTALKPAHEPVVCARKPFNAVPLDWRLVATVHHALAGLLWLSLSPAKRAELSSPSSQVERDGAWCASALVSVALDTSRDGYDETATYSSPATASTSLSIASSWSAILAALSAPMSTSTTSTRSSTTTALRTLNSLLGPITSQTTMPKCGCLLGGPSSPAPSVASSSSDEWAKWLHTLSASVPATATEGIALAVASALAQVAGELSDAPAEASSATPTATTGAAASRSAFEPIVVGRKPLTSTVAANVLTHGTGALNIDACRIGTNGERIATPQSNPDNRDPSSYAVLSDRERFQQMQRDSIERTNTLGRWPANVVLDEHAAAELDRQSGVSSSNVRPPTGRDTRGIPNTSSQMVMRVNDTTERGFDDSGGASRFFYVAKAPTSERPRVGGIAHPTVKPLDLMRWLVRLVTPPGGTVLEPFAGSGTTAEACVLEGFQCIAIEREAEYLPLIVSRLDKPVQLGLNFEEPS